ncbi:hypothetical protein B0H16DRAFT_1731436 [Mycena metata]|uniref:Uncharacterized protein n=1 Tax=Mycena metata TaxID=1033252 RepID=A0AAD7MWD6_9AGAR|nr:hypothetical protein B0H16DRAFT_1731436 [Mycena metata]
MTDKVVEKLADKVPKNVPEQKTTASTADDDTYDDLPALEPLSDDEGDIFPGPQLDVDVVDLKLPKQPSIFFAAGRPQYIFYDSVFQLRNHIKADPTVHQLPSADLNRGERYVDIGTFVGEQVERAWAFCNPNPLTLPQYRMLPQEKVSVRNFSMKRTWQRPGPACVDTRNSPHAELPTHGTLHARGYNVVVFKMQVLRDCSSW